MVEFQFKSISKLAPEALAAYKSALQSAAAQETLDRYGISGSALRLSHFFAQIYAECGALTLTAESLNYRVTTLMKVWPKRFPTPEAAAPYAHNEKVLAERVYGGRMGNTNKGDGYKFRGRGLLQITGRQAYARYGDLLKIDLENDPDLAFGADNCLAIAAAEWAASGYHGKTCNEWADENALVNVTYAVNGGQTGIEDRRLWLGRMKVAFAHVADNTEVASRATANLTSEIIDAAAPMLATPVPLKAAAASTAGFPTRIAEIAIQEWTYFGSQTYDIRGHLLKAGHKEGEDPWFKRVGEYWREGVHNDTLDGTHHSVPWSAAFISFVMRTGSAGTRFIYSPLHSVYIFRAIRDHMQNKTAAGYWGWRLNERRPRVGDVVCWSRVGGIDFDHQSDGSYPGHCDIVVALSEDHVDVIGGNVGDSVTKRPLSLDTDGFLKPARQGEETLFCLMGCRIQADDAVES